MIKIRLQNQKFKKDAEKTRFQELTDLQQGRLVNYVIDNYQVSKVQATAYALKQPLTRETGIYIYEADMYMLMTELGFQGFIDEKGKKWLYAKRRKYRLNY